MIEEISQDSEARMKKSVEVFRQELTKLRTGRAHPSLLEHIKVEYYGNPTPLNQVASVNVEGGRTLVVTPWEKPMVQPIEKAIMTSDLNLNPTTAGMVIRVPLPTLTEERRAQLIKVLREEGEKARVSIRNIRREANSDFKDLLKEKSITEDDERQAQNNMQKLTDKYIAEVDHILVEKEKELTTI